MFKKILFCFFITGVLAGCCAQHTLKAPSDNSPRIKINQWECDQ